MYKGGTGSTKIHKSLDTQFKQSLDMQKFNMDAGTHVRTHARTHLHTPIS